MCYPTFRTKKCLDIFAAGYLVILTLAGFIDGVAFSFTPKPDATVISFLAFLDGLSAIVHNFYRESFQVSGS
jgi:hypothetical protein